MERTNIRTVVTLPELLAFACVDVSFISLRLVLPVLRRFMQAKSWDIVALIKPQFEAGKGQVGKGGVVRDPRIHRTVLETTLEFCANSGWGIHGLMVSPIKGPAGNIEFLVSLAPVEAARAKLATLIDSALSEAQLL
jgi:23S rRNA (cytidine1920-2'-O)/16S rRNA (cytidine1409-2'-O)-methyltransferase